jgi:D-amino-acid dehydrogenase
MARVSGKETRRGASAEGTKTVVIIGAGIIGTATALTLLSRGYQVTIVDPRSPGTGASCGSAATIANYHCLPLGNPAVIRQLPALLLNPDSPLIIRWRYLPQLVPWLTRFVLASRPARVAAIARALAHLQHRVDADYQPLLEMADAKDLVVQHGCLYLYGSAASYARARGEIELRRRHGIALDELSAGQIADLEPKLARIYHSGILFPSASHLRDPLALVERFVRAFLQRGGALIRDAAKAIERDGEHGVFVRTTSTTLAGHYVVLAAGAWSRALARQVGDRIPLDTERGYHVVFPGAQALLSRPVGFAEMGFYMTPLADALRVAGTVEFAGLDAPLNRERTSFLARGARRLLPQLSEPTSEWLGFRPSLPDSLPVIGPSLRNPRVLYAFGHGHLGVTLAGVTARIAADLIDGYHPAVDPTPYRPERFE